MNRILVSMLLCAAAAVHAIPGVDLAQRNTKHFELLIDRGNAARLDSLAPLAEAAWERLAKTTGYRPNEPIRVVFHDEDEYANGWAYAANSWVNVWLEPTPFELRGGVDWVSDVLSHELSHVFTLRALGLDGHLLSLSAVGGIDLAHFQGSADLQWTFNDLESWLAEGLAQVGAESCRSDTWDPQRDALEHGAWKSGKTLPDGLQRTFWGDSRESELVYNQGYSFLRWVLSTGKMDLPALLKEGKKSSLRDAVEASLGRSFADALEGWRAYLRTRHGEPVWPAEPGRQLLSHDAAATWTSETSVVGDSAGNLWITSSKANDYGIPDIWEVRHGRASGMGQDVAGRLHLSPDGSRLGAVVSDGHPDRRTIQDLWEYRIATDDWRQVTENARVLDGDFLDDGYLVVSRGSGRNRVMLLDNGGHVRSELPVPAYGDPVQVCAGPAGTVFATTMGKDGFRLLASKEGGPWIPVFADSTQRRDPVFAKGRLWYARVSNGRWEAASSPLDGSETIEARGEGGILAPVPVGDSLLVSRWQKEGFVAVKLPLSAPSPAPQPLERPVQIFEHADLAPVAAPWKTANALEFLDLGGYGAQFGYIGRKRADAMFDPGSKWLVGGGIFFTNSTMESSLEFDAQGLHGGVGQKAGWDQSFALSAHTEAWSPILDASLSYTHLTLENQGGDTAVDTFFRGDTLPFILDVQIQASAAQMLTSRSYVFALWAYESQGIGAEAITGAYSADLLHQTQVLAGIGWENFEPGRFGALSGTGARLAGGWVAQSALGAREVDAFASLGEIRWATNIQRRLLLGADLQGQAVFQDSRDPSGSGSLAISAGIPLPVPEFEIPLTHHRRWTFVDPILRLGNTASAMPASSSVDAWKASAHLAPNTWDRTRSLGALRPLQPWKATDDIKVLQVASTELSWKVITLSNFLSSWYVGVDAPSFDSDMASRLRWRAGVSL